MEERVCDKLHLLLHPQPTGSEAGTVPQHAPVASDLVVGESSLGQGLTRADPVASKSATLARAAVKYKTLLDLALSTTQDLEEDGLYLESAENERIQKLMLKTPKYEKTMERIKSLHSEYLEFTALHQPDSLLYSLTKLNNAVQAAIKTAESLIKGLEEQDEDRQLCTLLPITEKNVILMKF